MSQSTRRKRRRKSDLGEVVVNGLVIIAIGLASQTPWLRSLAIALILIGALFILLRIVRYFKVTRPLNIYGVDEMSGVEFERFIEHLLKSQGYEVKRIGGYEDYGVDLIASRGGRKHAIQVKRWNQRVHIEAVRAAVAGMTFHKCDRAVVITNNYFTRPAKELAAGTQCKLIDRDALAQQIATVSSRPKDQK
ncbi:MAG: restriction endonuclease [Anaerolineales bacterium]|nr:restriction endonuclease [Anaerolineales bacterium]